MRKIFCSLLMTLVVQLSLGQGDEINLRLNGLTITPSFPENLLKTRTVVLYRVSPRQVNPRIRGEWKSIAKEIQPTFRKSGIDAVLHYYLDDILSGPEAYHTFLDYFDDRDIKNAAFIFKENDEYIITIADLQDRQFLLKPGQNAWQIKGQDLESISSTLYRATANSGLELENRLILETPEFGDMMSPIKAKRNEFYDLNFSSEKLAIPAQKDSAKIRAAMADYPYRWGFVDPSIPEKDLRKEGYQYILYFVNTVGKSAKQILEYRTTNVETDYISEMMVDGKLQVESNSINTPVYKFYIKHIYSGNIFVGKRWDAASRKPEALTNYIQNLRNELVKN